MCVWWDRKELAGYPEMHPWEERHRSNKGPCPRPLCSNSWPPHFQSVSSLCYYLCPTSAPHEVMVVVEELAGSHLSASWDDYFWHPDIPRGNPGCRFFCSLALLCRHTWEPLIISDNTFPSENSFFKCGLCWPALLSCHTPSRFFLPFPALFSPLLSSLSLLLFLHVGPLPLAFLLPISLSLLSPLTFRS